MSYLFFRSIFPPLCFPSLFIRIWTINCRSKSISSCSF
nr:MAG TPA: hypothetical protein [Caudoviricetes sp.]